MDAENGGRQPHGRRFLRRGFGRGLGALVLGAALAGALGGGVSWFAGTEARAMLDGRVERDLDAALGYLRLAETANRLSASLTQLENAPSAARRQTVQPHLRDQSQRLAETLHALQRSEAARGGADTFRPQVAALRTGADDLDRLVERRLTVERDLRAALERIAERHDAFRATLGSLPPGEAREALEGHGRALASQLLLAGTAPPAAPPPRALTDFRKSTDALWAGLDALPIDPASPRRADTARQLVALGTENGNLFDLRQEQARLAAAAADTAGLLRDRAAGIASQAERAAFDLRADALAGRDRALAGLAAGPAGVGVLTALSVLAGGAIARRRVRPPSTTPVPPEAERNGPEGSAPESVPETTDEVPPLHILLAEDEPVSQMAAASMLRRAGHTVMAVGDGHAALAAVEADRPDLVLMDLRMPGMDGAEATRRIRALADGMRARVRIVMLTASAVPGDRERCRAAGADAVLEKPLRLDRLQPVLERLFAIDAPPPPARPSPAVSQPVEAMASDAPVFDAEAIAQMREHLPAERVAALIGNTVATLRRYHAALAGAWADGDMAQVGAMAHKIAGVSGIYGCMALRAAAQALERAVETGDGDPTGPRERLDGAFAPALAALEARAASLAEA